MRNVANANTWLVLFKSIRVSLLCIGNMKLNYFPHLLWPLAKTKIWLQAGIIFVLKMPVKIILIITEMDSNQYSDSRGRNGNQANACHQLIRGRNKKRRVGEGEKREEGEREETMVTRQGWREDDAHDEDLKRGQDCEDEQQDERCSRKADYLQ